MDVVTTSEMVHAASRANCLGSLPPGDLPAYKCSQQIQLSLPKPTETGLGISESEDLALFLVLF